MKTSLMSLCATLCAILIFLPPAYGQCDREVQGDTVYLQCLIDHPNPQGQVTIPQGSYITGPIQLRSDLELTFAEGVMIEPVPHIFEAMYNQGDDWLRPAPYQCRRLTDSNCTCGTPDQLDKCQCGCSCVYYGAYGTDHSNPDAEGGNFNKLFLAKGAEGVPLENLTIIGNGATLKMPGAGVDYPFCSESIHALALIHVRNVEVKNLKIEETAGDGVYIEDGDLVNVHDCTIGGGNGSPNRNGISIISGTDITIEDCTLTGKTGTSPQAGIDIEPNTGGTPEVPGSGDRLVRIRVKDCWAQGNGIRGFMVNVERLNRYSAPVDILFENCTVNGDFHPSGWGFDVRGEYDDALDQGGGKIEFVNCTAIDPGSPSTLALTNFLNLEWDLTSLITLKFTGLDLQDNRPGGTCSVNYWDSCVNNCPPGQSCIKQLINIAVRGQPPPPTPPALPDQRIIIEGKVSGGSHDPLFSVQTQNCPSCAPPYLEISGCLVGNFEAGIEVDPTDPLPNLLIPKCGNAIVEDCEECDDANTDPSDGCDHCLFATAIYAQWDNNGPSDQPIKNVHYTIEPTGTDSPPNVLLTAGHDDWRIWSVNQKQIGDIGDIGVLSSFVADDIVVKLVRPDGAPAARNVKGITLVPLENHSSNIAAGEITGNLGLDGLDALKLQGTAGSTNFTIDGDVSGNINIPTVESFHVNGAVNAGSTITIGDFAENGTFTVDGLMSGDIDICPNDDPPPVKLPDNLHLASIDSQGTVCETHICGSTDQLFIDPSRQVKSISFRMSDQAQGAIRVTAIRLHRVVPPYTGGPSVPFEAGEGKTFYVGPPHVYKEWLLPLPGGPRFIASRPQDAAHFRNWSQFMSCEDRVGGFFKVCNPFDTIDDCSPGGGDCSVPVDNLIHVFSFAPSSQYDVQLMPGPNAACAEILTSFTNRWADVEIPYETPGGCTVSNKACFASGDCDNGQTCTNPFPVLGQPDLADISALVNTFKRAPGRLIKARALLGGNTFGDFDRGTLDKDIGFDQIAPCVDAFKGVPYPHKIGKCENSPYSNWPIACMTNADCPDGTEPCVLYLPESEQD